MEPKKGKQVGKNNQNKRSHDLLRKGHLDRYRLGLICRISPLFLRIHSLQKQGQLFPDNHKRVPCLKEK